MPYREINFEKETPLHIISRAVEERKIFEKKEDCYRFLFQIYVANIGKSRGNISLSEIVKIGQGLLEGEEPSSKFIIKEHPPLVYIFDWVLVTTHYHFLLLPTDEKVLPLFMKKLNGGFAKYFNLKYERKGTLFASRYKAIPIKTDFQLDAVNRYINIINPLDVFQPGWRKEGLRNLKESLNFLKSYPFSSFLEKIGKRNSKFTAPKEIRAKYGMEGYEKEEYFEEVKEYIKEFSEGKFNFFQDLFLE